MSVRERAAGLKARFDSPSRVPAERDAGPYRRMGGQFDGARARAGVASPLYQTRSGNRSSGGFSPLARREIFDSPGSAARAESADSPEAAGSTSGEPQGSRTATNLLTRGSVSQRTDPPSPQELLDAAAVAARAQRLEEERDTRRARSSPGAGDTSPGWRETPGRDEMRRAALLEDVDRREAVEILQYGVDETTLAELIASEKFALGHREHAKEDAAMLMKAYDTNGDGKLDKDELDFLAELVEVEKALEREEQALDRQKVELISSVDAALSEEIRRERERMAQKLQERQNEHRERLRQTREDLHRLNGQLDAVKDQIAGPLNMPRRRGPRGDGRSLAAVAQALDEEMTNSSAYTELKSPSFWGLSDDRSLLRPKTRIPRSVSRSKATLARAQQMHVQRSPSRSPRRRGTSPHRTFSVPSPTEATPTSARTDTTGEDADMRRFKRPQSPLRSAASNAVAAAASPLLHEMLQAASPSVSRFGSPGRYSHARSGSPGRGRPQDTANSPLASVRALSASRTNAHAFVQQLRSRSPGHEGTRSPIRTPRGFRLDSDDENGDGGEAKSNFSPATKRPSTGVRVSTSFSRSVVQSFSQSVVQSVGQSVSPSIRPSVRQFSDG